MKQSIRILVVDDDPDILGGTARLLEKAGYAVARANGGAEALKAVHDHRPDLVLLDRDMPGIDGIEVCRQIKRDPSLKDTLVIITSGTYTGSDDQAEGLESGADGYIVRPVANRELLARVDAYARIIELTRALHRQAEELKQSNEAAKQAQATSLNLMEDAVASNEQLHREIAERQRAEAEVRRAMQMLTQVMDNVPAYIFWKDRELRYLGCNKLFAESAGLECSAAIVGKSDHEMAWRESAELYRADDRRVLESKIPKLNFEESQMRPDGSMRCLSTSKVPLFDTAGHAFGVLGIYIDITERKQAEIRIQQLNRVYSVLSDINQTIVREKDTQALLTAACQIAVEKGRFLMAWIGLLESGPKSMRVAANAGATGTYLEKLATALAGDVHTPGPTSDAVRRGEHVIANDIEHDPLMISWRDSALPMGFRASAAFPLKVDGQIIGTFNLYAGDVGFFDENELRLLDELAMDLGFALEVHRREKERKIAEQALLQSEERYRLLAENASDVIWVLDVQSETYRYLSPSVERLRGYKPEEVMQHDVTESMTPESARYLRALAPGRIERFRQGQRENFTDEVDQIHKNGHVIHTEITSRFMLNPATGRIESTGVTRDITLRKRIEASHARLAMAVEQSAEAIVITDTGGTILYANPAFEVNTGYTVAEVLGRNPRVLKSGKHDAEFYRQMWGVLTHGGTWKGHFVNKRKDGSLYEEEATISSIRDATGKVVNYVAVKRDVTREMQLDAQFRQSQKMEAFGLLAGGIAHDFNNILSVILGYSEMWLMKLPPDAPVYRALQTIKTAGERAAGLTRQLLAFSRKTVLEPKILNLNGMVDETKKMLVRMIGEDIQLTSILDPGIPLIKIDPGQISQVLINLAVNARDAMPQGGTLTFRTGTVDLDAAYAETHPSIRAGRYVMLSISDTGCGMPPETLARIFEPFFTTKGVGKGTGLGLAVVHGVMTQSDGSIDVDSQVGVGTTFKLYFPIPKQVPQSSKNPNDAGLFKGSETILVVDDESGLRSLAQDCLKSFGYTVLTAESGQDALVKAGNHTGRIDLMLTDVVMPGMSGRKLVDALKQSLPKLKVIFMSGYTDDSVVRYGIDHEAVTFLQKPFSPFDLLKKVREELEKQ